MLKRLCLFAGYHKNGLIASYALEYVRQMAKLADVYYMADCQIAPEEMAKLAPFVKAPSAKGTKSTTLGPGRSW